MRLLVRDADAIIQGSRRTGAVKEWTAPWAVEEVFALQEQEPATRRWRELWCRAGSQSREDEEGARSELSAGSRKSAEHEYIESFSLEGAGTVRQQAQGADSIRFMSLRGMACKSGTFIEPW